MKKQTVICFECENKFEEKPKRSFLGFRKFLCPKCENKFIYPLTSGYRYIYWFVLVIFTLIFIVTVSKGGVALPGLLIVGAVIALRKDKSLKENIPPLKSNLSP